MIPVIARDGPMPRVPRESALTRWFWQQLGEGEWQTSRCRACGRVSFPPRRDCPDCWGGDMEWAALAAGGRLYARTVIRAVPMPFLDHAPLDVGVVDLDDGVRLLCWLIDGAGALPLDTTVTMVALRFADGTLFAARPAAVA